MANPPTELMARAARIRDEAHGTRVTYSPKVFIPLTMLCRDKCGYCTFAKAPARLESPYLTPDEVLAIACAGAAAGCHERSEERRVGKECRSRWREEYEEERKTKMLEIGHVTVEQT